MACKFPVWRKQFLFPDSFPIKPVTYFLPALRSGSFIMRDEEKFHGRLEAKSVAFEIGDRGPKKGPSNNLISEKVSFFLILSQSVP